MKRDGYGDGKVVRAEVRESAPGGAAGEGRRNNGEVRGGAMASRCMEKSGRERVVEAAKGGVEDPGVNGGAQEVRGGVGRVPGGVVGVEVAKDKIRGGCGE